MVPPGVQSWFLLLDSKLDIYGRAGRTRSFVNSAQSPRFFLFEFSWDGLGFFSLSIWDSSSFGCFLYLTCPITSNRY